MKKKIFIACAMHGKSLDYIDAVRKQISLAVSMLYDEQIEIIDQVHVAEGDEIKEFDETHQRIFRLGRSIQMLGSADLIIFASDYGMANGCRVEKFICDVYKMPYKMYGDILDELKKDSFKWNCFRHSVNTTYAKSLNNNSSTT
jgi:hypothetical protein